VYGGDSCILEAFNVGFKLCVLLLIGMGGIRVPPPRDSFLSSHGNSEGSFVHPYPQDACSPVFVYFFRTKCKSSSFRELSYRLAFPPKGLSNASRPEPTRMVTLR